jgi:hypothetical protein
MQNATMIMHYSDDYGGVETVDPKSRTKQVLSIEWHLQNGNYGSYIMILGTLINL